MSDEIIDGKYKVVELLAVSWTTEMMQRFPNASHVGCRQEVWHDGKEWRPYDPVRCHGWHCNRCGAPTDCQGGHNCPDRVQ